jgi:hypothetical protein
MDSFPIPEPSLSSRAMLCSLSISMWCARKHDPDASEEIAVANAAFRKLPMPYCSDFGCSTSKRTGWIITLASGL